MHEKFIIALRKAFDLYIGSCFMTLITTQRCRNKINIINELEVFKAMSLLHLQKWCLSYFDNKPVCIFISSNFKNTFSMLTDK
jgi:hypothetical protein